MRHRGFVLWAFKLDHLQPVKKILFQIVSNFLSFILGEPIIYYPREGKEENEKWELTQSG